MIVDNARGYLATSNLRSLTRPLPSNYGTRAGSSLNGHNGKPEVHAEVDQTLNGHGTNGHSTPSSKLLILLSAASPASVQRQAANLADHLDRVECTGSREEQQYLADLAYTLAERRSVCLHRAALVSSGSIPDLVTALRQLKPSHVGKKSATALVFTGQGSQWYGMGRQLMVFPAYRQSLARSEEHLSSFGASWSAVAELSRSANESRVNEAEFSQPLCTTVQVALVDLLRSWGYRADAVVGHSSGEIAAAYAAELIDHRAAIAAAFFRGLVVAEAQAGIGGPGDRRDGVDSPCRGSMAAVNASEEQLKQVMAPFEEPDCPNDAVVACYNGPSSFTISGSEEAINQVMERSESLGISVRRLKVNVAYHSPRMNHVAAAYLEALKGVSFAPRVNKTTTTTTTTPTKPCVMYSSVTGKKLEHQDQIGASYWVDNLVSPVKFSTALTALCIEYRASKLRRASRKSDIDMIIEIGPHAALAGPIRQTIQSIQALSNIAYASALRREEDAVETALNLAGQLFEHGHQLNMASINNDNDNSIDDDHDNVNGNYDGERHPHSRRLPNLLVDLPEYAWDHSTAYWAEPDESRRYRQRKWPRHDLLGAPVKFGNALEPRWRNWIRFSELPWLRDHRVQSLAVYPAAGFITMAIEAVRQLVVESGTNIHSFELREVSIGQALFIPDNAGQVESMISLRPSTENSRTSSTIWHQFFISSAGNNDSWLEHCRGLIRAVPQDQADQVSGQHLAEEQAAAHALERASTKTACVNTVDVTKMYSHCRSIGLDYGPTFANITRSASGSGRALCTVVLPDIEDCMPSHYHSPFVIHPATLDACFHGAFALNGAPNHAAMPTFISSVVVADSITKQPGDELEVGLRLDRQGKRDTEVSLKAFESRHHGGSSMPVVEVKGLKLTSMATSAAVGTEVKSGRPRKTYFRTQWSLDPSFVTSDLMTTLCRHLEPGEEETERLRRVHEMAFYMAEQALAQVPNPEQLSDKGKSLYDTFERSRDCVRNGTTGFEVSEWVTKPQEERRQVWEAVRNSGDEGNFFAVVGDELHNIMLGKVDALSVAMQDDALGRFYANSPGMSRQYHQAAIYIDLLASKNPHLRILEIGAGTGGATVPILEVLGGGSTESSFPRFVTYHVSDISTGFFEKLKLKTDPWGSLVEFHRLDIESDPAAQGFELGSYDLIIAANVLHATKDIHRTMSHVRSLMKEDAKLILIELMRKQHEISNIFGIFDGWWLSEEPERKQSPLMTELMWDRVLRESGFSGVDVKVWDNPDALLHQGSLMISSNGAMEVASSTRQDNGRVGTPLLLVSKDDHDSSHVASSLSKSLNVLYKCSPQVVVLGEDKDIGLPQDDSTSSTSSNIVILDTGSSTLLKDIDSKTFQKVKNYITQASHVLWVTSGATLQAKNPDAGLVPGMLRTLRIELDVQLTHLDIDPTPCNPKVAAENVMRLYDHIRKPLGYSTGNSCAETEYSQRQDFVLIPRFVEDLTTSSMVSSWMGTDSPTQHALFQPDRPLKLEIAQTGRLDSIYFDDDARVAVELPDDQVEIEVHASSVNFRDIMMAMGQIDTHALGCECSGVVTKIGANVTTLKPGDRVSTYADGTFSDLVRTDEIQPRLIPDWISFEEAATLPIIFCTALHSTKVAQLGSGDTVLIHAASGGLGQALIQLCQQARAVVYVTVGTPEKKTHIMEQYGIPESHIFSSRNAGFAEGIMRATSGRGVDIIFNSLSSELLRVTWGCIASFGRFIELGKQDFAVNSRLEMAPFARNVTFAAVDLVALLEERPTYGARVWTEVLSLLERRVIRPVHPTTTFGFSEIEVALRTMQSGKHLGKLVIVKKPGEVARAMPRSVPMARLDSDATYLLVGGLGGIGRSFVHTMYERGARNVVFTSRSGLRSPVAQETVASLAKKGVRALVFECDVSDKAQLQSMLDQCRKQQPHLPPIRGVIHLGLVLEDTLFQDMSLENWQHVLRPKVQGTWNLHHCLSGYNLDFFVLLSSMVGILGNAGQAAYSAASSFQDAFSSYRDSLGLPAVAVDLGLISQVGYVAEREELAQALRAMGYDEIPEDECMAIIESALCHPERSADVGGHVMTGIGLGRYRHESLTTAMYQTPQFAMARRMTLGLSQDSTHDKSALRLNEQLRKAGSLEEFENHILAATIAKISKLLMIPEDVILPTKSMSNYGLDSLVAVVSGDLVFSISPYPFILL